MPSHALLLMSDSTMLLRSWRILPQLVEYVIIKDYYNNISHFISVQQLLYGQYAQIFAC